MRSTRSSLGSPSYLGLVGTSSLSDRSPPSRPTAAVSHTRTATTSAAWASGLHGLTAAGLGTAPGQLPAAESGDSPAVLTRRPHGRRAGSEWRSFVNTPRSTPSALAAAVCGSSFAAAIRTGQSRVPWPSWAPGARSMCATLVGGSGHCRSKGRHRAGRHMGIDSRSLGPPRPGRVRRCTRLMPRVVDCDLYGRAPRRRLSSRVPSRLNGLQTVDGSRL